MRRRLIDAWVCETSHRSPVPVAGGVRPRRNAPTGRRHADRGDQLYRDPKPLTCLPATSSQTSLPTRTRTNLCGPGWQGAPPAKKRIPSPACSLRTARPLAAKPDPGFASDIDTEALDFAQRRLRQQHDRNAADDTTRPLLFAAGRAVAHHQDVREGDRFALHNLVSDPPFSRLDLVVCRNVLIYLDQRLQQHLMEMFSVVLNRGDACFLAAQKPLGPSKEFFTLSKQWRLFRNEREDAAGSRQSLMPRSALSYRG